MDVKPLLDVVGYAHRGLHGGAGGPVENSASAIQAAAAAGVGIEFDVQMSADDVPFVFHDETLQRLAGRAEDVGEMAADRLAGVKLTNSGDGIMTLADCLALVDGRVPLLIEIKSRWGQVRFNGAAICRALQSYRGPAGVMSFDPAIIEAMQAAGCALPCGLVTAATPHAGCTADGKALAADMAPLRREEQFARAREIGAAFLAHDVEDLEAGHVGEVAAAIGVPLFSWTVRTAADLMAAKSANAMPIFEGPEAAGLLLPLVHQDL